MRNVWVIARREYNQYFSTPVSYAVAFAILLIVGLIFALTVFQAYQSAFSGGGFGGSISRAGHQRNCWNVYLHASSICSRFDNAPDF